MSTPEPVYPLALKLSDDVTAYGLFVELADLQFQGLVHISAMSDKFVRYDEKSRTLKAGRITFKLGQTLRVRVSRVDFDSHKADFVLA